MTFQPVTLRRGADSAVAGSARERVELEFEGWQPGNDAPIARSHADDETNVHGIKRTRSLVHLGAGGFARLGRGATVQPVPTGQRPDAVAAGAGTQIYDSTLHKPLWSDGIVWRDSTGTPV